MQSLQVIKEMKDEIGYRIIERLGMLIKLTALNVLKDEGFKEQVRILSNVGLRPKEIAEILGKTPNNVRVMLSYVRKQNEKKKTKSQTQEYKVRKNE